MRALSVDDEDVGFGLFMSCYPHEAYEYNPERFWRIFHKNFSHVSREQLEQILEDTKLSEDAAS